MENIQSSHGVDLKIGASVEMATKCTKPSFQEYHLSAMSTIEERNKTFMESLTFQWLFIIPKKKT